MKKSLLVFSMILALALAIGGCATKGDLAEAQARDNAIATKADPAIREPRSSE